MTRRVISPADRAQVGALTTQEAGLSFQGVSGFRSRLPGDNGRSHRAFTQPCGAIRLCLRPRLVEGIRATVNRCTLTFRAGLGLPAIWRVLLP
jgi:hypothetical protein